MKFQRKMLSSLSKVSHSRDKFINQSNQESPQISTVWGPLCNDVITYCVTRRFILHCEARAMLILAFVRIKKWRFIELFSDME